jgi:hypothetical protein
MRRLERLVSTFIVGYGASEASGRFGPRDLDPRGSRGQLSEGELPAHFRLGPSLGTKVDWDAEFAADVADLLQLIEARALR